MSANAWIESLGRYDVRPDDLSGGDERSLAFDGSGFEASVVTSADDPAFAAGYAALWNEFAEAGELEPRDVLQRRLAWRADHPVNGYAMRYETVVIHTGERLAAVCDHTAIVHPGRADEPAVVHLSHMLVLPRWRGSGLAGWLRAWPLSAARACLRDAGRPPRPVTLVGEVEPADLTSIASLRRLHAFERAGFRKVDPAVVPYLQPDFRPAAVIDSTGGPRPLPLWLVVRRVGRENDHSMSGGELRAAVAAIYAMYADGFRPADMKPNVESLNRYPSPSAAVALMPPTSV